MSTTRKYNINSMRDIKECEKMQSRLYNQYDYVKVVKINQSQVVIRYE